MKKFAELITQRTTSIVIAQKDLGMIRDNDASLAEKALQEASYTAGKADAILSPLAELTDKDNGLIKQNQELKAELQKLVTAYNYLQGHFNSLSDSFVRLSQPTMTKGERV